MATRRWAASSDDGQVTVPKGVPVRQQFALDPELAAISVLIPAFDLTDLTTSRRLETSLAAQGRRPLEEVAIEDLTMPRRDGGQLRLRIYRPRRSRRHLPALLYIHGGAFVLGSLATEDDRCEQYALHADCAVIALDYRLAPEDPFPAAYEDCIDALHWMKQHARQLGLDPRRLAVGGNSAGGALAAAVALESRTPDVPSLVHLLLVNPVLDHRQRTASMQRFTDTPVFNNIVSAQMWNLYLSASGDTIDYRASPALADDLTGVPPTSIWIAEYDPLRDEGYEFVMRLLAAGVSVGVIQYPGTIHGFDGYRMTTLGQRALRDQVNALRRAFRT